MEEKIRNEQEEQISDRSQNPETVSEETKPKHRKQIVWMIVSALLVVALAMAYPTYSWFANRSSEIGAYAPIASPESLYIGAGHTDLDTGTFENIRYLYFYGIDTAGTAQDYYDYIFCVYGKGISKYRIQLAYTTNNAFTYELYHAEESQSADGDGWISYETHGETPQTYYYRVDSENPSAIAGGFLDQNTTLGLTYDTYESVNTYANPKYWQTSASPAESGSRTGNFVNYYVLRIRTDGRINDRETDVICISAKAVTTG